MTTKKSFALTLCLGAAIGAGLTLNHDANALRSDGDAASGLDLPREQLQTFTEVYQRIKLNYVDDAQGDELIENAIRGMLSGLDPHSSYLDGDEYQDLKVGTTGEFGGLGIEVTMENGFVKVVSPIDDTPAQRAGVEAGDLIIRLDDKPVKGLSLGEAVDVMRGKPGSKIELTVVREGTNKPMEITLTRDVIKVQSVKSRMLEEGYGYVRVSQFQSRTTDDLQAAMDELLEEGEGDLKGLVLDLRNNPGGLLNAAVGVADTFMDNGAIVSIKGRHEGEEVRYGSETVIRGDRINGAPLVVLINGGSASASEIVSGALQDGKRAVIMGSKSFGKGSVQTINELRQGGAVKLTTARYYTPSGRSIQAEGIEPDIKLSRLKVELLEDMGYKPVSEADLSGHLENDTDNGDKKQRNGDGEDEPLARKDYQLYEALNLLKGLQIMRAAR
ncbi:MAG: S41 family peptidase [Pseudomonadota bacterium]